MAGTDPKPTTVPRDAGGPAPSPPVASEPGGTRTGSGTEADSGTEGPQAGGGVPLEAHDFPSGGGSGGAQAYSRKTLTLKKKKSPGAQDG